MAMSGRAGAYFTEARPTRTRAAATSGSPPRPLPAHAAAGRLRASKLPPGVPTPDALSHPTGLRPSQVPVSSARGPRAGLIQHQPAMSFRGEGGGMVDAVPGIALRTPAGPARIAVQCMCTECKEEEEEKKPLQAKGAPSREPAWAEVPREPSPVLDVVGKGGGQPLAPRVRADMEAGLGADLSDVRIHTGAKAAQSAAAVSAQAYTVGNEIVFGPGSFAPGSPDGRHTLAHELIHVLQQRNGPVPGTDTGTGVAVSDPSDSFEQEAESIASQILSSPQPMAGNGPSGGQTGGPTAQKILQRTASARSVLSRLTDEEQCDPSVEDCEPDTDAGASQAPGTDAGASQPPGTDAGSDQGPQLDSATVDSTLDQFITSVQIAIQNDQTGAALTAATQQTQSGNLDHATLLSGLTELQKSGTEEEKYAAVTILLQAQASAATSAQPAYSPPAEPSSVQVLSVQRQVPMPIPVPDPVTALLLAILVWLGIVAAKAVTQEKKKEGRCINNGSGGCNYTEKKGSGTKRCSYGCDNGSGASCRDLNLDCGPGNWDPQCSAYSGQTC